MSDPSHKSIAVDHETWETLTTWADNECRTVSGQIKFLVKKYSPKLIEKQKFLIEGPLIDTTPASTDTFPLVSKPNPSRMGTTVMPKEILTLLEKDWTQNKCTARTLYVAESYRSHIMDTLFEYGDPITCSELAQLVGAPALNKRTLHEALEAVQKQTAGMYKAGLLKRRRNFEMAVSGIELDRCERWQYQLTTAAHRLLKQRDKRRAHLKKKKQEHELHSVSPPVTFDKGRL
tara:strand:+ start:492 stop:1190 length:699 start_codon:yes stop_codon:yes gene_type:complete